MPAIIFSHQRCGSSNLLRFVRAACGVPALMEPFNIKQLRAAMPKWRAARPPELRQHFQRTLRRAVVVKHIYGEHEPRIDEMVARLLDAPIIFLYRENAEAAALSTLVARRAGGFSVRADAPLGRVGLDDIKEVADATREKQRVAREQCAGTGKPVLAISYERLFAPALASRRKQARDILDLLSAKAGIATAGTAEFDSAFSKFMAPTSKINSADTYRHIENIDELRASFPWLDKEMSPSRPVLDRLLHSIRVPRLAGFR